jgi:hypothetical protein
MPGEELADTVNLIIVAPLRKAGEFNAQVFEPRRRLRQPHMPRLDPGGLSVQVGEFVFFGHKCRGIGDAMCFWAQLLDQRCPSPLVLDDDRRRAPLFRKFDHPPLETGIVQPAAVNIE